MRRESFDEVGFSDQRVADLLVRVREAYLVVPDPALEDRHMTSMTDAFRMASSVGSTSRRKTMIQRLFPSLAVKIAASVFAGAVLTSSALAATGNLPVVQDNDDAVTKVENDSEDAAGSDDAADDDALETLEPAESPEADEAEEGTAEAAEPSESPEETDDHDDGDLEDDVDETEESDDHVSSSSRGEDDDEGDDGHLSSGHGGGEDDESHEGSSESEVEHD